MWYQKRTWWYRCAYTALYSQMMAEVLAGIRVIKLYAWERTFAKRISQLRYHGVFDNDESLALSLQISRAQESEGKKVS